MCGVWPTFDGGFIGGHGCVEVLLAVVLDDLHRSRDLGVRATGWGNGWGTE